MRKSVFNFDINKHKKLPRLNVKAMSIAHENSDGPRMLLVSDYIPYSDINDSKEKSVGVVFGNEEGQVLFNLLGHVTKKNSGFKEVVVFNWYNVDNDTLNDASFDSKKAKDAATRLYANQRLRAFIHKMKPDVVCFSGMEAFNSYMQHYHADSFPKKVNFSNKFNRLIELEDKGFTCKYIGTMDIRRAASQKQEDIKKYTNLLGFVADALNTARRGENRYNVKLGKIDIVYINSIAKFEKFYKKLCVKDIVSIDSETVGVKRIANTLFSIQFAFDRNPKRSYFLPIDHPDTPFNKKELAYIKQRLADYFEKGKSVFHIYQNGKFDIQQFLQQLQIRFYNHKIYDVMAGEYALDENRKLLAKRGGANAVEKPFSLDAIAEYYGIDIYSRIAFSKGDRVDMTQVKLDNKFIKYSCIDTVVPILIVRCQLKEAEHRGQKTFKRFILRVISNTILAIAQMEHTGAYIDKDYVYELKGANSAIDKQIKDLLHKIKDLPSVKKANRLLIQSKNIPTGFVEPWVFNINKEASKQMLFFKVLKLEPTKLTKKGTGAINKDFKNKYKDLLEVKLMDDYEKLKKLKTTYVDGFFKKLTRDLDCRDSKIRSDYIWNEISTGRLGSRDPNLQNIISRGDLAKTIKRCFIAQEWRILFKNDYSAHEVRGWANLANDIRLSGSFDSGLRMRRKLRILINKYRVEAADWRKFKDKHEWDKIKVYEEKKKLVDGLKNKAQRKIAALDLQIEVFGDIHKLNCQHFWGTHPLKVTADQRQAVKAVVFGVIYGKTAAGLAESLGITEEAAQELIDLLFEKFKEGGDWIKTVIREAQKQLFVLSPAGMIRHLWAYLHNKQGVRNAMDRRGPNSIIQGLASQQGVDSMRNLQVLFWNYIVNNGVENPLWKVITNYVHDSVESENWIHMAPLHLYFLEHASTTLVHKNYEDIHGMKFKVGLEVEFQMGPSMDKLYTWKWGYDELREYVIKTLDWQKSMFKNPNHDKIAKRVLKAFEHNLNLISKIRAKELKRFSGKHNAIEKTMLMKPHHIKKLGFITNVEGVN